MNKRTLMFLPFMLLPAICVRGDILDTMRSKGLLGRITYLVVDEDSRPIPNVSVHASFQVDGRESKVVSGETDSSGRFSAESRVNLQVNAWFDKVGFHRSTHHHWFLTADQSRMKDGKWLPWNPTVKVTMRKEISPKNKKVLASHILTLRKNVRYGYDLLKNALVDASDGDGHADFYFTASGEFTFDDMRAVDEPSQSLSIEFAEASCGIIRKSAENYSTFIYAHEAPDGEYANKAVLERTFEKDKSMRRDTFIASSEEYLIFRICRMDGEERNYHYGIIRRLTAEKGDKGDEFQFDMWYYINEDADDKGIEYNHLY